MIARRVLLVAISLASALLVSRPSRAEPVVDVVVLLSNDSAATPSGFNAELSFLDNLMGSVLPYGTTQVGLVEYATGATIEVPLTMLDSTSEPSIVSTINGLSYGGGATYITDAVNNALTVFNSDTNASDPKLMILLQDTDPYPAIAQNPCSTSTADQNARAGLNSDNVTTLEIATSNVSPTDLSCLLTDPSSQYLSISSLNVTDLEGEDSTIASTTTSLAQSAAAAVPDPSGWSFLALGFAASVVLRRRRSRAPRAPSRSRR